MYLAKLRFLPPIASAHGHEIDFICEDKGRDLLALEVKAGQTYSSDLVAGLQYFETVAGGGVRTRLVYGGKESQKRNGVEVFSWRKLLEKDTGF